QDFTITSLRPKSALETESNNQNMPILSSSNNNQIPNNISSKRILSSRPTSTSASRLICYRPIQDRESRNKFDFSKRMNPITVPDSRANGQFDHISLNNTLRSRPMSPLESRNNTMNILMNDICNTTNNSIQHFDMINNVIPSPFNEMTIY
ncbi:15352_t:CDS:1, partial [Gigaspora rosea]